MNNKFTPGPWEVHGSSIYTVAKSGNGMHKLIATVDTRPSKIAAGDAWATADLIASAPDLLAERDALKAQRDDLLSAMCKIDVLGILPHTATADEFKKAYAEMAALAMMVVSKIGGR